ncbi:CidA/LrgA family protein [Spongiibacter sp.]|uniref:CidA/LrgA family protein n=1 Tax=Spongiibacter sp. TaxID=2024860 RepID=UPI003561712E
MLAGFLSLFACQLAGEVLQRALGLPLPGQVLGMFLLFALLCLRGLYCDDAVPEGLSQGSQRLIELLPMLLMAPAAGVFFLGAGFADQWPAFIAAVSVGTVLTMIFCGLLLKALAKPRAAKHD